MKSVKALSLGLVIVVFSVWSTAQAGTVYVAETGSDSTGDGSMGNPYRTISNGVAHAESGDTVSVAPGDYPVTAEIALASDIDVIGQDRDTTIVRRESGETRIFNLGHDDAVVSGLTITNGLLSGTSYGGGLYMTAGTLRNCVVTGNEVAGNGGGMYLNSGGRCLVSDCIITTNIANYGGGVYFFTSDATLINCEIVENLADNGGGGVQMNINGPTNLVNCIISHNCVSDNNGGGIANNYSAPGHEVARNCLIVSNIARIGGVYLTQPGILASCTIAGNDSTGGSSIGGLANAGHGNITNCIIAGNSAPIADRADVFLWQEADTNIFHHCCIQVTPNYTPNPDLGNMIADPLYEDAASGNYRLQRNSPCVDAGINLAWMDSAVDLDGFGRIDSADQQVDMGAYEVRKGGTLFLIR